MEICFGRNAQSSAGFTLASKRMVKLRSIVACEAA
jgi:hypothetical protein